MQKIESKNIFIYWSFLAIFIFQTFQFHTMLLVKVISIAGYIY